MVICVSRRILIALCVVLFALFMVSGPAHNYYPKAATVYALDFRYDIVTLLDSTGNEWRFSGCEDWCLGDIAAMIVDGRGTVNIYDDEIVMVRYAGNLGLWDTER